MLWCSWLLELSARRSRGAGRLDGIDRNERHGKQLTDTLDIVGAGLTGEEAVVADAVKALRQDMKHESPDELGGRQRHGLVAGRPFDSIVLVTERDASLVGLDQPAVGDCDAMGVAREVGENLLWSGERRLGVDMPTNVIERFEEGLECRRVGELGVRTEELQSPLRMCCFEQ